MIIKCQLIELIVQSNQGENVRNRNKQKKWKSIEEEKCLFKLEGNEIEVDYKE